MWIEKVVGGEKFASSGNRTRAARVAGEHSTTEPTMPHESPTVIVQSVWAGLNVRCLINVNAIAWMLQLWKMNKGLSQFECHKCGNGKSSPQSAGFEPALPEGNWFLVSRLNHSAMTAELKQWFKIVFCIQKKIRFYRDLNSDRRIQSPEC